MATKRKSTKKKPTKRKTTKHRVPEKKSDSEMVAKMNREMGKLILCTVCDKNFATKRSLKTHKHKGE